MNGRKAKALRKRIYGEMSADSSIRRYARYRNGMMRNLGLRAEYQAAKREASRNESESGHGEGSKKDNTESGSQESSGIQAPSLDSDKTGKASGQDLQLHVSGRRVIS